MVPSSHSVIRAPRKETRLMLARKGREYGVAEYPPRQEKEIKGSLWPRVS